MKQAQIVTAAFFLLLASCGQSHAPVPPPAAEGVPSEVLPATYTVGRSTATRIGVAHVFDTGISTAEIAAYPNRYNVVWGSFAPAPWRAADPYALVSRYYILTQDSRAISGRSLAWWRTNAPSWILYACTPSGGASHEYAYTPGSGFADVPLDIHNPSVRSYQINSLATYAAANGYNAVAIDEVLLSDVLLGGNPTLGQSVISGYFGCGIWQGATFVRHYASRNDPAWAADVLAWIKEAHQIFSARRLALIVNHPAGPITSTEAEILANIDVAMNETGYTDYGKYATATTSSLFSGAIVWTRYAQQHGVRVVTIDKFALTPSISTSGVDYSLATYALGNEGASDLVITGTHYNIQPYYSQYAWNVGTACGAFYRDLSSSNIYIRRFANAVAVVNAGSAQAVQVAHLPSGHTYRDVMGRAAGNPLTVARNDGYLLATTNGCS